MYVYYDEAKEMTKKHFGKHTSNTLQSGSTPNSNPFGITY